MTHFYQCQSGHWCASDEKIIESEWGKAWCSVCKLKIIKSSPTAEPPSLSKMPVVLIIDSTNPIDIHGRLYATRPTLEDLPPPESSFSSSVEEFKEQDAELSLQHRLLQESDSQENLYIHLQTSGFAFLARDLNFRDYKKGAIDVPDATIPEPGIMATNSYTTRAIDTGERHGIGRLEVVYTDGYFTSGLVTYPDYFVLRNRVIYAIELKTPRAKNFKTYMSDTFWTDKKFGKQSIHEEITNRKRKMAPTIMQVLLFDTRNMRVANAQAIIDIKNSITYLKDRKAWFESHINSILFFDGTLSKLISMTEILAGKESEGTQRNILSFFK
ncbi:hypothetical protein [Phytopseudomonas dryadis]|uniref:hypothetical protein n=1 Tax=Pseudomonadaceae TaxID=135621 RepID=UPI001037BF5E|nr:MULTISPECIES: hypothetical protein [Pseudomonas]